MQKIDGHVHLEHGPLSVAYVEQFVAAAQKAGLDCLQILDHTACQVRVYLRLKLVQRL